jgi:hypothetical protein
MDECIISNWWGISWIYLLLWGVPLDLRDQDQYTTLYTSANFISLIIITAILIFVLRSQ